MAEHSKIRVLIVDDSAIVRKILTEALSTESDIEVVGTAPDPLIAEGKIRTLKPDVLTLDIEMPHMDGLSFLRKLMTEQPLPVVMISSLAQSTCPIVLEALEAGAVEVLGKPGGPYSVGDLRLVLAQKIRSAARARLRSRPQAPPPIPVIRESATLPPDRVVAMGASTGGTEALKVVLEALPANIPPIVIVQHIPPVFSKAFADRMNSLCRFEVKEAESGDLLKPGRALVAPGDRHMVVRSTPRGYMIEIKNGPRVCYQRPSVDILFQSLAPLAGGRTVGVLLTGMGSDGARGLLQIQQAGGHTIAQDEASCVVYGMPREAARLGAVDRVLPLDRIAAGICEALQAQLRISRNASSISALAAAPTLTSGSRTGPPK